MGSFKEFYLNEVSDYLKQLLDKRGSDKETKFYRTEDKWAKITKYKGEKIWRYAMGFKGELKVPEFRSKQTSVKDMAEIAIEYWFKDKG